MKTNYLIEPRNPYFEVAAAIIKHEIRPQHKVTFFSEVDLTQVEALRQRHASLGFAKPSYTAFVVKAVALALRDYPEANRRVVRGLLPWFSPLRLQRFLDIDVTVAVERKIPGAAMAAFVDVLRQVDTMSLTEVHRRLQALSESDADNNVQWRDFSRLVTRFPAWFTSLVIRLPLYAPSLWVKYRGGAVMVSAPGKYGVDTVAGNWWSPIGISFGMVAPRPVVQDMRLVVRPTFNLTVNFDVRVMAGAQAAHFCRRLLDVLVQAETEMQAFLPFSAGASETASAPFPAEVGS